MVSVEHFELAARVLRSPLGSIYALRLFGRQIVVLNSPEVARELLEGNSATVYTNRPLPKIIEL